MERKEYETLYNFIQELDTLFEIDFEHHGEDDKFLLSQFEFAKLLTKYEIPLNKSYIDSLPENKKDILLAGMKNFVDLDSKKEEETEERESYD